MVKRGKGPQYKADRDERLHGVFLLDRANYFSTQILAIH